MKYRLAALLTALAVLLAGCKPVVEQLEEETHIYASFYPIYALSSLVLDGVSGVRLTCLVQPQDGCLRSYEISDWDLHLIAYDADAVIIGGRGLESFEDMLFSLGDSGPALITAMYSLTLYNESDDTEITEESSHLDGANPYYYMSVSGAGKMVENIAAGLKALLPEKADQIAQNALEAQEKLYELEKSAAQICAAVQGEKVILLNEAMIYPAIEYGLTVDYWYDRESSDTLYGDSLDNLLNELSQCEARVILIEKQAPAELTRALTDAGYSIALIDTMTAYSLDFEADSYVQAQLNNARAIALAFEEALSNEH